MLLIVIIVISSLNTTYYNFPIAKDDFFKWLVLFQQLYKTKDIQLRLVQKEQLANSGTRHFVPCDNIALMIFLFIYHIPSTLLFAF